MKTTYDRMSWTSFAVTWIQKGKLWSPEMCAFLLSSAAVPGVQAVIRFSVLWYWMDHLFLAFWTVCRKYWPLLVYLIFLHSIYLTYCRSCSFPTNCLITTVCRSVFGKLLPTDFWRECLLCWNTSTHHIPRIHWDI